MSTFDPPPPYTPQQLEHLYPAGLCLQHVQVLRSIVMTSDDASEWDVLAWRRRLQTFDKNDVPGDAQGPAGEVDNICLAGETTDKGRQTTRALGTRLRKLYVDQLQFMPQVLTDAAQMSLRATPIPRALDAVQQAFVGMYPPPFRAPGLAPPIIRLRQNHEENLFDQERTCKRYALLYKAFERRSAEKWNDSPELDYIRSKIGKHMPPGSGRVALDGKPRLSGIMDTVNATRAHGPATRLPAEFYDPLVLDHIDKVVVDDWFAGNIHSSEFRMLGKGQMAGDVVQKMVQATRQQADASFSMSGAHDTTLAGYLTCMGAFGDRKWPPFTSHMAIELFREAGVEPRAVGRRWGVFAPQADDSRAPLADMTPAAQRALDGWYVRIRYNDEPVTVPFCAAAGNNYRGDGTLCALRAFKEVSDAFTPRDWKAACGARLDEAVDVRQLHEPAGWPAGRAPALPAARAPEQ